MHILDVLENEQGLTLSVVVICGEDQRAFLQNDIYVLQCSAMMDSVKMKDEDNPNGQSLEEDEEEEIEEKNEESPLNMDSYDVFGCLMDKANWTVTKLEGIPFGFSPRFGHSSMVLLPINIDNDDNGNGDRRDIVVFAGYSGEMSVLNDFWMISVQMKRKEGKIALIKCKCLGINKKPTPRHGHCMNTVQGNSLVIYGGIDLQFQTFSDVHLMDIELDKWRKMKHEAHKTIVDGMGFGRGMSANEKAAAKAQFLAMGFVEGQIDAALVNAQNVDQALGSLLQ